MPCKAHLCGVLREEAVCREEMLRRLLQVLTGETCRASLRTAPSTSRGPPSGAFSTSTPPQAPYETELRTDSHSRSSGCCSRSPAGPPWPAGRPPRSPPSRSRNGCGPKKGLSRALRSPAGRPPVARGPPRAAANRCAPPGRRSRARSRCGGLRGNGATARRGAWRLPPARPAGHGHAGEPPALRGRGGPQGLGGARHPGREARKLRASGRCRELRWTSPRVIATCTAREKRPSLWASSGWRTCKS